MMKAHDSWLRWPSYLAWLFFLLVLASVVVVRSGQWKMGLAMYALAGLLSLITLVLFAVVMFLPRWRDDKSDVSRMAIPAVPGAALFVLAMLEGQAPPIHDITTDTQDPPIFEAAEELRGTDSNPLTIKAESIEQQKIAYPDVATLRSPRSYASSYNLALTTARDLGWEITREDPNAGFIEAVDTTAIMQFKDDVIIRVRSNAEGSVVDLRSVSRVGISDLGANAKRILAFASAFSSAAGR